MKAAGIDFGTSNSSVGFLPNGIPTLVDFGGDGCSVPSAIFYPSESGQVSFGKQAVSHYAQDVDGRLLRSLKSVLGSSLMGEKTTIRNRRVAFSDIIQDFFGYLKLSLAEHGSSDIDSVVVGRPVHFVDDDIERDKSAEDQLRSITENAGFKHVEFQLEPIAAALSYESTLRDEQLALVVDIGGGTADFTVIRLSPDRHQQTDRVRDVLSTVGVHIGGTDFDRLLSLQSLMPLFGMGTGIKNSTRLVPQSAYHDLATWHRIPLLYNQATVNTIRQIQLEASEPVKLQNLLDVVEGRHGHAVAKAVETAKIELSNLIQAQCKLNCLPSIPATSFARDDFEQAIDAALEQLIACVRQGLDSAAVNQNAITSVFYTGGSSSIPVLQRRISELFTGAQQVRGDIFGSVGLGLTIDAGQRFA